MSPEAAASATSLDSCANWLLWLNRHPQMPSHETILAARDRMLEAHPRLKFDAVHLASLEWDVEKVADFLNRFYAKNAEALFPGAWTPRTKAGPR